MTLSGKVAVITGSSMGIGEAIAKLFADEGASVVLLSRGPRVPASALHTLTEHWRSPVMCGIAKKLIVCWD